MTTCILNHPGCHGQTDGSIGAAGIHWSMICQNCKDIEDAAVVGLLTIQTRVIDVVTDAFLSTQQPTTELGEIA